MNKLKLNERVTLSCRGSWSIVVVFQNRYDSALIELESDNEGIARLL